MTQLVEELQAAKRLPPPALARQIRIAAGVSQKRMAEELEVQRTTVARWERSERRPRGSHLIAYVALLKQLQEVNDK